MSGCEILVKPSTSTTVSNEEGDTRHSPKPSEAMVREACETLSSQRGSRERILQPLKKMKVNLLKRKAELINSQKANDRELELTLAYGLALKKESEEVSKDIAQLDSQGI